MNNVISNINQTNRKGRFSGLFYLRRKAEIMSKNNWEEERRLLLLFFILFVLSFIATQPVFAGTTTTTSTTTNGNTTITVTVATTTTTVGDKTTITKVTTTTMTTYKEVAFTDMTATQKSAVLADLIAKKIVKNSIKVNGGTESLNLTNWNIHGIISYGETSAVNAAVKVTNSSNYDSASGQWRYWGYDINGGLYGNDDFPRDSDTGKAAYKKNWLTRLEIKKDTTAYNYIGGYTIGLDFPTADKKSTAQAFLAENSAWANYKNAYGDTINADYILGHFFFNSVLGANGITQGQFIGVHRSTYDNNLYYQTFSVSKGLKTKFDVPTVTTQTTTETGDGTPAIIDPPAPVVPDPEITADAKLSLATRTYCGHLAPAADVSSFTVDGKACSAAYVYANNLADNSFYAEEGQTRRISKTQATVCFGKPGTYDVTLTVSPNGGNDDEDTQSIEVLPTPTILHSLTGTQKENRKQVLNLQVATNPNDPLTELSVTLGHVITGGGGSETTDESVTLVNLLGKGMNTLANSATIKTRAIEAQASDQYFTNCKLEFLTKNPTDTAYRYTVHAKTKGGAEDTVTVNFDVAKDNPPVAAIGISSGFVREKSSNTAAISMTDTSTTDGDQVSRAWEYRPIKVGQVGTPGQPLGQTSGLTEEQTEAQKGPWTMVTALPGYNDQAFGSGKTVGFDKTGVGRFEVSLFARDDWTEETLPEYITEADHLTGSAIAASEVINVAPVVSLSPIDPKTAEIAILTGGKSEYETALANQALIEQTMLQNGVDAKITVEQMQPTAEAAAGNAVPAVMSDISTPLSYQGNWSVYEASNFIVDEQCMYKLDASWPDMSWKGFPQSPYTVTCWDTATKAVKWKYTFTDALFGTPSPLSSNGNGAADLLSQDVGGRYLFLSVNGKTLILAKDSGAALTTVPMEIGVNVTSTKGMIYALKKDGIYGISSKTGIIKKAYNGAIVMEEDMSTDGARRDIAAWRMLEGKMQFLTARNGLLCRGIFDSESETIKFELIGEPTAGVPYSANLSVLAVDTAGKIVTCYSDTSERYNYKAIVTAYGRNNRCAGTNTISSGQVYPVVFPVTNAKGECNYVGSSSPDHNSYCGIDLYGLANGYHMRLGNYPTEYSSILFAKEINGKAYIYTGANWVYVKDMGYGIYPERVKPYLFDLVDSNLSIGRGATIPVGLDLATYEYGYASDTLTVMQAGYNTPGGGFSQNLILKWDQTLPMILERYTAKHFSTGADINAVVIFDEANASLYTAGTIADLSAVLAAKNGRLIQTTRGEITGSELGSKILAIGEEKQNMLGVAAGTAAAGTKGTGTLKRSYQLDPDMTYYYEYDVKESAAVSGAAAGVSGKDILTVAHDISGSTPGAEYGSTKYTVADRLFEDFNDEKLAAGFSVPSGAAPNIKEGCLMAEAYMQNKGYGRGETSVTVTIPSGYMGAASFDWFTNCYNYQQNNANICWQVCNVTLNGQPWQQFTAVPGSGHYAHPDLLGAGTYTVKISSINMDTYETAKMCIDNFTVDLLTPGTGQAVLNRGTQETLSAAPAGGGFSHISGSFKTPFASASYARAANVTVVTGLSQPPYFAYAPGDKYTNAVVTMMVPGNKTAPRAWFNASSNMPNTDGSHCMTQTWSGGYRWYDLQSSNSWKALPPLSGTSTLTMLTPNKYGSTSVALVKLLLTDPDKTSAVNGNGFCYADGAENVYFAANDIYKTTGLTFTFPEGNSLLKNLRIYSIDGDGEKIYLEEDSFASSANLAKWQAANAKTAIVQEEVPKKDDKSLVYKKGELVAYSTSYFDYEADPSKKQFWKYTHTPMNDGANPDAAVILDEGGNVVSISERF